MAAKIVNNIEEKPLVVIKCITYNHAPYIQKCLDGFVMQKTNFPYIAIVHDDASTDGTSEIVEKYAERYPDKIFPILEKENLWSKHDGSLDRAVWNAIDVYNPRYVAQCEGDDFWTDPLKLQKQMDVMMKDNGISLCYTKSVSFSTKENRIVSERHIKCKDFRTFLLYDETITLTALYKYDLYKKYCDEIKPDKKNWLMGDTPLWLWLSKNGKVVPMEDITATYNAHEGSVSRTGSYNSRERFNKSALDIRLFFVNMYNDCFDLVPYLTDRYYRSNMYDAYRFRRIDKCIFNFIKIKEKDKGEYKTILLLILSLIYRKLFKRQ